jgi:hypothetical protein
LYQEKSGNPVAEHPKSTIFGNIQNPRFYFLNNQERKKERQREKQVATDACAKTLFVVSKNLFPYQRWETHKKLILKINYQLLNFLEN